VTEKVVAQKGPYRLEVHPGTYWWCQCGRSAKQPFCDGSHMGTGLSPLKVVIEQAGAVSWCGCKRSANGARCDGSHKKLP